MNFLTMLTPYLSSVFVEGGRAVRRPVRSIQNCMKRLLRGANIHATQISTMAATRPMKMISAFAMTITLSPARARRADAGRG